MPHSRFRFGPFGILRDLQTVIAVLLILLCLGAIDGSLADSRPASKTPGAAPPPTPEDEAVLKAAFEAWEKRQAKIRSGRFEWKQTLRIRHHPWPDDEGPARKTRAQPEDGPKPGDLVTIKEVVRVLIDQEKFSFSVVLAGTKGTGMPSSYRAAYDGKVSQMYFGFQEGDDPLRGSGLGRQSPEPYKFDSETPNIRPIMVNFRPLHPKLGRVVTKEFRAWPRQEVNGVNCVRISRRNGPTFWCDPARDYIVILADDSSQRWDISYKQDPVHGWIPSRWKSHEIEATMEKYSINTEIPSTDFQIDYPPRTQGINFDPKPTPPKE